MSVRVWQARVARAVLWCAYQPFRLLPARRKVTFLSRQHSGEPEDFSLLIEAIHRVEPSLPTVVFARELTTGFRGYLSYGLNLFAQMFHVATSRVVVLDGYSIVVSWLDHKKSLTVVQLWHALGAFKRFGYSILDQPEGRSSAVAKVLRMHANYDIVCASSESARAPFAEAFHVPLDRVVVAPLPRVDRLRDESWKARVREEVLSRHPSLRDHRVVVYAPTLRRSGPPPVDIAAFAGALTQAGFRFVYSPHPVVRAAAGHTEHILAGESTQDLLTVAHAFVTDYSSTAIEAAVAGVPVHFLAPDLDDYRRSPGFYLDYERDLPGAPCRTVEQLVAQLARGEQPVDAFARFAVDPSPGSAADRIAALVRDRLDSRSSSGEKSAIL